MTFKVNVLGIRDLTKYQLNLQKYTKRGVGISMFKLAQRIAKRAKKNLAGRGHIDTGKTWNSIRPIKLNNLNSVVEANGGGILVETGVRPHKIPNAFGIPNKIVNHPGVKRDPWFEPAIRQELNELPKNLKAEASDFGLG